MSEPKSNTDKSCNASNEKVSRRDFLISIGAGGAVIAGTIMLGQGIPAYEQREGDGRKISRSDFPQLIDDARIEQVEEMCHLSRPGSETKCIANSLGEFVLRKLDGRHRVEDISRRLAVMINMPYSEKVDAKVSLFIAQVAMAGFLTNRFFVNIYEVSQA